jgi:hypothetical protein
MKLPCVDCITKMICKNYYKDNGLTLLSERCELLGKYIVRINSKTYRGRTKKIHLYFGYTHDIRKSYKQSRLY